MDLPGRANCILSNLFQTHMSRDLAEKPSSTVATSKVNDTGLKSLSTDIGGPHCGTGTAIACFSCAGTLFKRGVVYVSKNRESSKANSVQTIFVINLEPGDFLAFKAHSLF